MREISKQLGFSVGTGHRTLSSVEKKRSDIAEGRKEGWIMLNDDEQQTKYTNELLEAWEYWVENNNMVRHCPFKDNLVIKPDRDGSIVQDPTTRQPVRVQKMMLMCNPRILHNHMIEHFEDATEGNREVISESKLRDILKTSCSHVKKMSAREKLMCGCETCVIFEDIHECLNLVWKKYIMRLKRELQGMRDGRRKFDLPAKLDTYIQQVCKNPTDLHPKYKSGWDAASQLGCPHVTIDNRYYCRFQCAVQECTECSNIWKDLIPAMERECTERISNVIFGTHSKCGYHGDGAMRVEGKECICEQCEIMSDEKNKV